MNGRGSLLPEDSSAVDHGALLVGPTGRPLGLLDLARDWMFGDRIRGTWRVPGRSDWPFEAILHASPLVARRVFRSAARRNLLAARTGAPSERLPAPPTATIPSAPARLLRRILKGVPTWQIAELRSDPLRSGPVETTPILPLPGTLRADPFALRMDGEDWLLFEEQLRGDRGRLRAARRVDGNWVVREGEMLPRPHHLSWPNPLVTDRGAFLLPETGEAGEVALLESTGFPDGWRKVRSLLGGRPWHDACLLRRGDTWWLFACAGGEDPQDHSSELHAFHSTDLFEGEFRPHDLNPLSVSVAGARPAGGFFERDGKLYRPAQDCRGGYGSGLIVYEVLSLGPSEWRERAVSRLDPPAGATGLHTLNPLPGGGWVVDLCA